MRQTGLLLHVRIAACLLALVLMTACSDDGSSGFSVAGGRSTETSETPPPVPPGSDEPLPPPSPPETLAVTSPVRLAPYNETSLLVSDYNTNRILIVDKGSLQPTEGFRLFRKPTGIAFADNKFFVGNQATRSVDVLDAQGRFLYHLGGKTGEFGQVNDLAVDMTVASGVVYVLDTKAAVVRVFDAGGTDTGTTIGAGVLIRPTALTLDPEGNLLVSDFGNSAARILPSIRIFNPAGAQISVIPGGLRSAFGGETTRFSTPQGVWTDGVHVFVVDALSGELQVYRIADKAQVKVLGRLGVASGELRYPLDVWVDATNKDVFVADNGNGRITVFRAGGILP